MPPAKQRTGLTELEGEVLALIWRDQPTTAYRVRHAFAALPISDLVRSTGTVYPAIRRLRRQGLVDAVDVRPGARTELRPTADGEAAVRAWISATPRQLPADPLRHRSLFLSILTAEERAEWLRSVRADALQALANVDDAGSHLDEPLLEIAQENARFALLARLRWLDRTEPKLAALEATRARLRLS